MRSFDLSTTVAEPLFACLRSRRRPELAAAIARDFSPRCQRHGHGCVVVDVSGLGRLIGEPHAIARELARACGLENLSEPHSVDSQGPRVAVAPTQAAALLLSLAHPGVTVVTGDEASALSGISVRVLYHWLAEIHDVSFRRGKRQTAARDRVVWASFEQAFDVLRRWGIHTLGELAALPAGDLSARLGQDGLVLQHWASGTDLRPLMPDPDVPRFVEHVDLEWPIDGLEPLAFVLARMLDPLSSALERADRGAAAIRLDLRLVDRSTHARVLQLPAAMRDPRVLRTLLVLDLESHPPSAAIDRVTIEIDPAPGRIVQYSLLERARPSAETLATLMARLGALVGTSRCGAPALLDTYRPDPFEMRQFADNPQSPINPQSSIRTGPAALRTPHSAFITVVLRRFRPPVAIRVGVERGRPARVAIDRRGMPGGRVEQYAGPWRSSGDWWEENPRPWNRDEWDVALSDGSVCRLFHERSSGRWFMEGILD